MTTIAIIGTGPTGIYTAKYLLSQDCEASITMFEAQAQAGKGTPYHQDWNEKEMLSNIASIELPPINETLVQWLHNQSDEKLTRMGVMREDITERTFFPRVALGEYFYHQLRELAENARGKLTVKTSHKVYDIAMMETGVELTVRENDGSIRQSVFDYVVMATGHAWPKETEVKPGYFLSPWPAAALATIPDCHVGIRGTSLSAIDAMVALSVARGTFLRNEHGELEYLPEPGTEAFHITMISRKGILPEADFFCPIPYAPLTICTPQAVNSLIKSGDRAHLLDAVFDLFKAELAACDPAYAASINLARLTLEQFSKTYFQEREQHDPFIWAAKNLAEAKANLKRKHTVPWRYAILRMHEVIACVVPRLLVEDHQRFSTCFKPIFVDDYATVPHESIERMLAMHRAGKLEVRRVGEDYSLDTEISESGALLVYGDTTIHFPAFIEATGQRPLSIHEFPFKTLWKQGLLEKATAPHFAYPRYGQGAVDIGGVALDRTYHPVSDSPYAYRLYCLSLPFMLGQFPFAQGITSSHEMGQKVAGDLLKQLSLNAAAMTVAFEESKKRYALQ